MLNRRISAIAVCAGAGLLFLGHGSAQAKPAECYSTDDGYFDCDFQMTDSAGSFTITGPDVTYILVIDSPGYASGFVNLGHRNVPLPGTYVRERGDPACWSSAATDTRICAW